MLPSLPLVHSPDPVSAHLWPIWGLHILQVSVSDSCICCLIGQGLSKFPFWGYLCFICPGLQQMTSSPFSRYPSLSALILAASSVYPLIWSFLSQKKTLSPFGLFCHFHTPSLPVQEASPGFWILLLLSISLSWFWSCVWVHPVLLIPRLLCHADMLIFAMLLCWYLKLMNI